MRNVSNLVRYTTIGVTAWIGGLLTERYKYSYCATPSVQAAVPLTPSENVGKEIQSGIDAVDSYQWQIEDLKKSRTSQIMRFGFPGLDNIRSFDDFVLSYDRRTRTPHWVFEHLTRETTKFNPGVDRAKCEFYEDGSVHPFFRSTNRDYKGSGYDRGHLAAAGNHRVAQRHCEQTFVLSNMSPQEPKFNREAWNDLEKHCRRLTKEYANVYVCTGPLFLPRKEPNGKNYVRYEVIGPNNVAVPTHFFKVILGEKVNGTLDLESYIMPNQPIPQNAPLYGFQVPVEAIERAAGLLFFDQINRNIFAHVNGRKS
jgi:endonuclease G